MAKPASASPAPAKPRRSGVWLILDLLLGVLTLAGIAALIYFFAEVLPFEHYDRILPNVYCAGVNLGGMTREEAQKAIEDAMEVPNFSVKVILPDGEYVFRPRQEGVSLDSDVAAGAAYAYGRLDNSAFGLYRAYRQAEKTDHQVNTAVALRYSEEDILSRAMEVFRETLKDPTESRYAWDPEAHTVTVTPGAPGRRIEPEVLNNAVLSAFETMDFSDIHLDYQPVAIDLTQLRAVCDAAAAEAYIPPVQPVITADETVPEIRVVTGTPGWSVSGDGLYEACLQSGTPQTVTLDMEKIEPWGADVTEACESLSRDPIEPYYAGGQVHEGENGYTMDWDAAAAALNAAGYGETVVIPMIAHAPTRQASEIESVLFRDQLSSCSTEHTYASARTNNLILACRAINGTVLNPGEAFSFNDTVGERTAEKGYASATVYVGSESVEELGGGICQVASTIYDAALYAELEITHREYHQFFVTYVPGGLDATVYYGSVDFGFRNNTDYPIRINAWVEGGYVNITLDGTKTNDHTVELTSTMVSSTGYTTVYQYSSAYRYGTQITTVTPYTGYSYDAYQNIYDGSGNLLVSNYLGRSYYEKRDRVITIGTG